MLVEPEEAKNVYELSLRTKIESKCQVKLQQSSTTRRRKDNSIKIFDDFTSGKQAKTDVERNQSVAS